MSSYPPPPPPYPPYPPAQPPWGQGTYAPPAGRPGILTAVGVVSIIVACLTMLASFGTGVSAIAVQRLAKLARAQAASAGAWSPPPVYPPPVYPPPGSPAAPQGSSTPQPESERIGRLPAS